MVCPSPVLHTCRENQFSSCCCCMTRASTNRPCTQQCHPRPNYIPLLRFFGIWSPWRAITINCLFCLPYSSLLCSSCKQSRAETPLKEAHTQKQTRPANAGTATTAINSEVGNEERELLIRESVRLLSVSLEISGTRVALWEAEGENVHPCPSLVWCAGNALQFQQDRKFGDL